MTTKQTGSNAEAVAANYLQANGFSIITRNWYNKYAEIDIVAKKDRSLCFVEAKYRLTDTAGDGFDYITPTKLHHMTRAAEMFVSAENWPGEYQLMAISIVGELDDPEITLVEI